MAKLITPTIIDLAVKLTTEKDPAAIRQLAVDLHALGYSAGFEAGVLFEQTINESKQHLTNPNGSDIMDE